jgi:hypothetical protein
MGREPPVDKAGAARFLVPISNYNGLPYSSEDEMRNIFADLRPAAAITSGCNERGLDKYLLAYLYIIAVFLYTVRRGGPLSGWPPIFCLLFRFG